MQKRTGWNNVDIRDNRYNQVLHMVSAAKGAQQYFPGRAGDSEAMAEAARLDELYSQVSHSSCLWTAKRPLNSGLALVLAYAGRNGVLAYFLQGLCFESQSD